MSLAEQLRATVGYDEARADLASVIVDSLDVWTAAIRNRSSAGRGGGSKRELYGIKKLRELILQLAVRGLLVPQDPNDEPASELLKKIATEKSRLIKEGKIKKSKKLPPISEEEKIFRLPLGWEWARVGSIYEFEYGDNLPQAKRSETGEFLVYGSNGVVGTHYSYSVSSPCIIIGRKGSAGALNLCLADGCWVTDVSYSVVPPQCLDLQFVFRQFHTLRLDRLGKGIKPGLSRNEAYVLITAVPPIKEQHRIVAKVDELMALCDQLEQQTEASLTAHETLVETILQALTRPTATGDGSAENAVALFFQHFDTLFTTEHSIDQLKQTILQLAVQGKLVSQDPSDEPAGKLYEHIEKERDAWLNACSKDNPEAKTMLRKLNRLHQPAPPFPLPESWACVHLIQICRMLVDCHNKTAPYADSGIPIIRTTNVRDRKFIEADLKFVDQKTYEYWSRRCPPQSGDIIFTREAPMGEALVVPEDVIWCLGQRTMLIRPIHEFVSNRYLLMALTEPHLLERASEHAVGLTVKHLRVGDVEKLDIPLPPLKEQLRIVAKAEALMALCDQLKSKLHEAQTTQLLFAESVAGQTTQLQ